MTKQSNTKIITFDEAQMDKLEKQASEIVEKVTSKEEGPDVVEQIGNLGREIQEAAKLEIDRFNVHMSELAEKIGDGEAKTIEATSHELRKKLALINPEAYTAALIFKIPLIGWLAKFFSGLLGDGVWNKVVDNMQSVDEFIASVKDSYSIAADKQVKWRLDLKKMEAHIIEKNEQFAATIELAKLIQEKLEVLEPKSQREEVLLEDAKAYVASRIELLQKRIVRLSQYLIAVRNLIDNTKLLITAYSDQVDSMEEVTRLAMAIQMAQKSQAEGIAAVKAGQAYEDEMDLSIAKKVGDINDGLEEIMTHSSARMDKVREVVRMTLEADEKRRELKKRVIESAKRNAAEFAEMAEELSEGKKPSEDTPKSIEVEI